MSNRSQNGSLGASNDKVEVGALQKSGPAQTGPKLIKDAGPLYTINIIYNIFGGAPTSTLSFEALSEPIFDRLDTKSDVTDLKIIAAVFISARTAP